jgi:hypothetical protein
MRRTTESGRAPARLLALPPQSPVGLAFRKPNRYRRTPRTSWTGDRSAWRSGHDRPVDRSAIDSTMTYVKRAKEIHAASADAKTYSENLKAAFPDLQQAAFVDLSASYLYTAPH